MKLKIIILSLFLIGCAYYNTFFNALQNYKSGTQKIELSKDHKITPEIRNEYYKTIDKCWKLIDFYGDSSDYADDALLLIGKSHYQVEEFDKTERFLEQFTVRYNESELLSEARLWLARAKFKLNKNEETQDQLNTIFTAKVSNEIAAQALFTLGELFYTNQDYENAIEYTQRCLEVSDDDDLSARAQFLIGNVFLAQKDYINAIENYNKIREYDAPVQIEYKALNNKVEAQIALEKFDLAIKSLQLLTHENRFTEYFPVIESRIGDCYVFADDEEAAIRQYNYVLQKYPRSEGSAASAFGLAKLMERTFSDVDSTRKLYLRVTQEYAQTIYKDEATARAQILKSYLSIRENITKDQNELLELSEAEKAESDTTISIVDADSLKVQKKIDQIDEDSTGIKETQKSKEKLKVRSRDSIISSLEKNKFALAEFFLLTLLNYDSAQVVYSEFATSSEDSVLKPKSYHALDYIYTYKLQDSLKADSIRKIILEKYPDSPYADYVKKNMGLVVEKEEIKEPFKDMYAEGEDYFEDEKYEKAIDLFEKIAIEDSGSIWAEKSRYAIAWIYETKIKNIDKAISAYETVLAEYPKSQAAKIAQNKIKEPPAEVVNVPVDSLISAGNQTEKDSLEKSSPDSLIQINREFLQNPVEKNEFPLPTENPDIAPGKKDHD